MNLSICMQTWTHVGMRSQTSPCMNAWAHNTRAHTHTHMHPHKDFPFIIKHTCPHMLTHTQPQHSRKHAHRAPSYLCLQVVYAGLRQQRQHLSGSQEYQRWHMAQKLKTPHLTTLPPPDLDPWASGSNPSSDLLLGRRLQELTATAKGTPANASHQAGSSMAGSPAGGKGGRESKSRTAAFLAAVDAALLNLRFEALEAHRYFPFHFATYQIGHEVRVGRCGCLLLCCCRNGLLEKLFGVTCRTLMRPGRIKHCCCGPHPCK